MRIPLQVSVLSAVATSLPPEDEAVRALRGSSPTLGVELEVRADDAEKFYEARSGEDLPGLLRSTADPADAADIHEDNARWLLKLVRLRGWPRCPEFGVDAVRAAGVIAYHCPRWDWQWRFYVAMTASDECGAPDRVVLAHFVDRAHRGRGLPQVYGTLPASGAAPAGALYPIVMPVGGIDGVNARRERMGLPPLPEAVIALALVGPAPVGPGPIAPVTVPSQAAGNGDQRGNRPETTSHRWVGAHL